MNRLFFCLCLCLALSAQDFRKLPDWASAIAAAPGGAAPQDADAWVLLDRTEIAYTGSGEIRQRRFRLVQVLTERGQNQATFTLRGLGGKASKVKRLKGWNLRPDGELVKLDQDEVVTIHDAGDAEFSTETLTGASLGRVVKGSLVAFESLESVESPLGPVAQEGILEAVPVRRWELEVAKKEGWFTNLKAVRVAMEKRHFAPWIVKIEETTGVKLAASDLPALPRDEGGHPNLGDLLPMVRVRFIDPDVEVARMWDSWNDVAKWQLRNFRARTSLPSPMAVSGKTGRSALEGLHAWMDRSLMYKQVYLTPERGWMPESAVEVGRKRYGDCKDFSCFFLAESGAAGFTGFPVLANITGAEAKSTDDPFPVFDHVIVALKLAASLGFASEVETPNGRYLLVDPTDSLTPLGLLGPSHRGRQVMICTDQGAEWVKIPAAALQPNRLDIVLDAKVSTVGRLTGALQIDETGDVWGLRSTAKSRGAKGVRDYLVQNLLDLPPDGQVAIEGLGDPLDLAKPFQVKVKVEHPQGLRRNQGEWELVGWGIPQPRPLIQKPGVARRYPVQAKGFGERTYQAHLTLPGALTPVLADRRGETVFCAFNWNATAKSGAGATQVDLRFDHRWKDADFGYEQKEEGLLAWKRDRNAFKSFREEALAFKALP